MAARDRLRRLPLAAAACLLLAACNPAGAGRGTAPGCDPIRLPRPAAGGPPLALLHSMAANALEFSAGSPGSQPTVLTQVRALGTPWLVRGRLIWTALASGGASEIRTATDGGCPRRLAAGAVELVAPTGTRLTALGRGGRQLIDVPGGRVLADLPVGSYAFSRDGRLVSSDVRGVSLRADDGSQRTVVGGAYTILGTLGSSALVVGTLRAVYSLDLDSGALVELFDRPALGAEGSPDGAWLAVSEATQTTLVHLPDRRPTQLSAPGPVTRLSWSPDSAWLAVSTLLGGVVIHPADGRRLDLGSVDVAGW
jgi:hypothetical protein